MSSYEDSLFYATFRFILFYSRSTVLLASTVPKCVTCEMYHVPYMTQNVTVEKKFDYWHALILYQITVQFKCLEFDTKMDF